MSSTALGGTDLSFDMGGGMTVAAGHQLHHDRNFSIDAQLRATHGDFKGNDRFDAMDSYVALLGVNWYQAHIASSWRAIRIRWISLVPS